MSENFGHILYILSTGPGASRQMTGEVSDALAFCNVVVGYDKYIEDLGDLVKGKEIFTSSMTQEIDRCNQALDLAAQAKRVALVSNGDANVFGMASLAWELAAERGLLSAIEIVSLPGVTALLAAAAKAGAPISQDFAVISLSDRLTPLDVIERRLEAALTADFVLGIYNPVSSIRKRPYEAFLETIGRHRDLKCPVFLAQNLGRPDEKLQTTTIAHLREGRTDFPLNMSTILIVGNSSSRILDCRGENRMLTPRGYLNKYDLEGARRRK